MISYVYKITHSLFIEKCQLKIISSYQLSMSLQLTNYDFMTISNSLLLKNTANLRNL